MAKCCSIDGCEKPAIARRWCGMHYARWRVHGDPLVTLKPRADLTQTKTCALCGATFTRRPGRSHAQWDQRQFCGDTCANRWRARNSPRSGANFTGGHGWKIRETWLSSPAGKKAARRAARKRKAREARAAQYHQRQQLSIWTRTCEDCDVALIGLSRRCAECTARRARARRDRWNAENPDYDRIYKRAYNVRPRGRQLQPPPSPSAPRVLRPLLRLLPARPSH